MGSEVCDYGKVMGCGKCPFRWRCWGIRTPRQPEIKEKEVQVSGRS